MGIVVYSLLWAMQDLYHPPYLNPKVQPHQARFPVLAAHGKFGEPGKGLQISGTYKL